MTILEYEMPRFQLRINRSTRDYGSRDRKIVLDLYGKSVAKNTKMIIENPRI